MKKQILINILNFKGLVICSCKTNDSEKNNKLVSLVNSGLKDLKEEIKKMSKAEIEIEDPELIVNIIKKILKFNEQNQQKG